MAVLPDGRVVSGSDDGRVLLWDRPGAGDSRTRPPRRPGAAVAVLPDGRVVSGGDDGRVLLWNPAQPGGPVELGGHASRVGRWRCCRTGGW